MIARGSSRGRHPRRWLSTPRLPRGERIAAARAACRRHRSKRGRFSRFRRKRHVDDCIASRLGGIDTCSYRRRAFEPPARCSSQARPGRASGPSDFADSGCSDRMSPSRRNPTVPLLRGVCRFQVGPASPFPRPYGLHGPPGRCAHRPEHFYQTGCATRWLFA